MLATHVNFTISTITVLPSGLVRYPSSIEASVLPILGLEAWEILDMLPDPVNQSIRLECRQGCRTNTLSMRHMKRVPDTPTGQ